MPLIRLAWLKPNQAISEGAYFYLENNKEYKSRTGSRVCGPKKLLVTFGSKSNMKKSFSLCLLAKRTSMISFVKGKTEISHLPHGCSPAVSFYGDCKKFTHNS